MDRVKLLFEDMSFSSEYKILEEADAKLDSIAKRKGLKVPSKDLAFFKCKYAMIDKENKNRCTLPRKEVEKAISSLTGKAVDRDHLRKNTLGYWLEGEIEGDDIVAYGCFWKANFQEEYEEIKKRMQEGKVKISFEAWGDRQFKNDGAYDLLNIEFAGGALLFDTTPAFPDAEVIEFSKVQSQVLEFAKVIENAATGDGMKDIKVPKGNEPVRCPICWNMYHLNESKSNIERCPDCQLKIDNRAKEEQEKSKEGGKAVEELLKKYNKADVAEFEKYIDEVLASVTAKDGEIASFKKQLEEADIKLENSKIELEKVTVQANSVKEELEKRVASEKASLIQTRKTELGDDLVKELSLADEDLLNDLKYENAKLKKELKLVKANVEKKTEGLEAGGHVGKGKEEAFKKQKSIQEQAFGK